MGKRVDSFQSNDGVLFNSEHAMLQHEATNALVEEFPQIKMQIPFIMANVDRIAEILQPIASHNAAVDRNSQKADETAATVAKVVGANRGLIRAALFGPSRKPRLNACPGLQDG